MKKSFGTFLAAAALLTPYTAKKDEETGEYEIRSLLLKVRTKSTVDEDGAKHFDYKLSLAGFPTKDDVETIRQNVAVGISKVSAGVSKCAKKVSDAFKNSCFAGGGDEDEENLGSEEDFNNIFDDEPEAETGSEAL